MIYLNLFIVFLQVGLFSIGGGYAAMPIIQSLVVEKFGWFTSAQFANMIAISEMTPGPITLNSSTFVGMQMAGVGGAIVATLSCILPSCIIVTTLAILFKKFGGMNAVQEVLKQLRPVIIGLIFASFLSLFINAIWVNKSNITLNTTNWVSIVVFALSMGALRLKKWKVNPILILLFSGLVGLIFYFI